MNDHNLDDLIIGEPGGGGSRSKNILAIAAIAIVVLIAGATLARLFFGDSGTTEKSKTAELSELVGPSMNPDKKSELEKKQESVQDDIPDELKPLDSEELTKDDFRETKDSAKTSASEKSAPAAEPEKKKEQQSAAKKQSGQKSTLKKNIKQQTKKSATKANIKKTAASKNKTKAVTPASKLFKQTTGGKGRWIQIGSFSKKPDMKYFSGIKSKGFNYTVIQSGGMFKVLVGPYKSYEDAKARLPEIREKLNKSAFVK